MDDVLKLRALNEAIWLRDNAHRIDKAQTFQIVEDIGEYGIYSARQIANFTKGKLSHQTVARLCAKTDRTGGRLNIDSLEDIRECLYDRAKSKPTISWFVKLLKPAHRKAWYLD